MFSPRKIRFIRRYSPGFLFSVQTVDNKAGGTTSENKTKRRPVGAPPRNWSKLNSLLNSAFISQDKQAAFVKDKKPQRRLSRLRGGEAADTHPAQDHLYYMKNNRGCQRQIAKIRRYLPFVPNATGFFTRSRCMRRLADNQQHIRKQARQTAREKFSVKDAVAFLPEYC